MAQTGLELLMRPMVNKDEVVEGRAAALWFDQGHTDNDGQDFQLSLYKASGRIHEQRENFVPRFGFNLLELKLDTTDPALPQQLVDVSAAVALGIEDLNGWSVGFSLGAGYAGTEPFNDSDAWYPQAVMLLAHDLKPKTKIVMFLDYNGNHVGFRDVPIPGAAYVNETDPNLTYVVGAPFSALVWKPTPKVEVNAVLHLVNQFDAEINYEVIKHLVLYGGMESQQDAFHVEGQRKEDRLFFRDRRVEAGSRWKPFRDTTFSAGIGYGWGGRFTSGWGILNDDHVADFSAEPYVRVGFETRF
jgi:hypothetical protein